MGRLKLEQRCGRGSKVGWCICFGKSGGLKVVLRSTHHLPIMASRDDVSTVLMRMSKNPVSKECVCLSLTDLSHACHQLP